MKNIFVAGALFVILFSCSTPDAEKKTSPMVEENKPSVFQASDTNSLRDDPWGRTVRYGARLMRYTNYFIGPMGTVGKNLGNKMTCTNCHLDAGTRPYGFNFFDSHRIYPQYRSREDAVLTMAERVNNCIERPMGGKPLPVNSKEMIALVSYIKWIGENYDHKTMVGFGLKEIGFDSLRADSKRGAIVYSIHCSSCHLENGRGIMTPDSSSYINPPLWGPDSYQEGSSMHRVIKAAQFIKYNMPNLIARYDQPALSDQEALDVAAFINDGSIHARPKPKYHNYPNVTTKPLDYFKGPYLDPFSEDQHAFGPWKEIRDFYLVKGWEVHF